MATQQHFAFLDDEVEEGARSASPQTKVSQTLTSPRASTSKATSSRRSGKRSKSSDLKSSDLKSSDLKNRATQLSELEPPDRNTVETQSQATASPPSRETVLKQLRSKVGCISTPRKDTAATFSTGCDAIDDWLPAGGLAPCTLTDWIAAHDSAAAGSLAMLAAADRLRRIPDRPLVIVDCDGGFYPPSAVALGVPVERMLLLRPTGRKDAIWAIDQSLRSGAVAAVWASLPMQIDDRDARRLQLAAETGRTPGLLVRDFSERGKPSFSEVQFYVAEKRRRAAASSRAASSPVASRVVSRSAPVASRVVSRSAPVASRVVSRSDFETLSVTLDRVRGGITGRQANVLIDDQANLRILSSNESNRHEAAASHLASQLANPTSAKRVAAVQRPVRRA